MAVTRHTITFTGRVQGVGFRATAQSVARSYDVAGWVRNEPDGSVKCVVEGEPTELERFAQKVKSAMQGFIHETQVEKSEATGEFSGFKLVY